MAAAARYAADAMADGPVEVELDRVWRKRFSVVHRYVVVAPSGTSEIYVKDPIEREDRTGPKWPRVISTHPPGNPARLQAAALTDLADAVVQLADPHIGAVRVLEGPSDDLLIMTAARGRPLRELTLDHVRWRRSAGHRELDAVMARIGRLLRLFHDRVVRADSPADLTRRDDLIDGAARLVAHLSDATGSTDVERLGARLVKQIEAHLPAELAVTTRFGDFGLTNLIVDDDGLVTAIDTLGGLRAPPLHDATYFVTAIIAIRPQLSTRNLAIPTATVDGWLEAFWSGYLDRLSYPQGAIATWSAVRLLERWAAKSSRSDSHVERWSRGVVIDGGMKRLIADLVETAERTPPGPELVNELVVS